MSSNKRTKAQVRKQRAALTRLKKSGAYKGRIDLRKKSSGYQQKLIRRLAAQRATMKRQRETIRKLRARGKPAPRPRTKRKPASRSRAGHKPKPSLISRIRSLGSTTSNVKRKKRRKVKLNAGTRKVKVGKATIRRKRISTKQIEKMPRPKNPLTTYALPFNRGGGETEWRRFTYDQLKTFFMEYVQGDAAAKKRAEWKEFAVKETWTFETRDERDEFKDGVEEATFGERIDEPNAS